MSLKNFKKSKFGGVAFWLADLILNIAVIFGLVFVIQTWLVAPFDVYGPSMCDTLNNLDGTCQMEYGEKIILNEIPYMYSNPKRGDIVVFKPFKDSEKYFIKRVIGLPGETVTIKNGEVYVTKNGETVQLEENYLNEKNKGKTQNFFTDMNTFNVPEGKYFLMGDNRMASTDSRLCFAASISTECQKNPEKAFVEKSLIRGKAALVWWPVKSFRVIHNYEYSESLAEK